MSTAGPDAFVARGPTVLISHPSPDLYGADRVLLETVSGFVAAGWTVVVTIPADGVLVEQIRSRGGRTAICPTVVLRKSYLRGFGPVRLMKLALSSLAPMSALIRRVDPDVVWVNTVTVPLWPLLARLMRRSVVVHVHEAEDALPSWLRRALAVPLSPAHVVVVNSDATGRSVVADGLGLASKIERIYNGVGGPPSAPDEISIAPEAGRRLRLLFVGRLSERKGPDLLIDMLATLVARGHDAVLELVGSVFPGYEPYEQGLRDAVRRHGLDDRVEFSGFLHDVWGAYDRADIAFVPSRIEPLGNTAVEAMLAGVPLVVSEVQGLIEVASGGTYARLADPDRPDSWVDGVEAMLADWPATRDRAVAAQQSAAERFGVDRYRLAVVDVAAGLTRRRPNRGLPTNESGGQ